MPRAFQKTIGNLQFDKRFTFESNGEKHSRNRSANNNRRGRIYRMAKTMAELMAELKQAQEERDALALRNAELESNQKIIGLSAKVAKSGGISVYGLGQFPMTAYAKQWETLAEKMPQILAFIEENRGREWVIPAKDDDGKATGEKLYAHIVSGKGETATKPAPATAPLSKAVALK